MFTRNIECTLCRVMLNAALYNLNLNPFINRCLYDKLSKNTQKLHFREFECGLTIEETAELCFKVGIKEKRTHQGVNA